MRNGHQVADSMNASTALLLLGLTACSAQSDLAADRAELLRLHELARVAHLEERADVLTAALPDSFLEIARGAVMLRSRADNRMRFQRYFDRVEFQEWDNLAPPRIRISPDGQMAYVVVQKNVRLTRSDSIAGAGAEHTVFAWIEVYEKRAGQWILVVVASTDRPGPP